MAKNSIRDYSATNSNNTDIQSIDIGEGCAPAGINNAIREVMADLKDVSTGTIALESPKFDSILDGNIKATDASGTDAAGTATTIKGGAGTGTGAGGSIVFQVADGAGSTGSSVNAHATAMTIADDSGITVAGDLTVDTDTLKVDSTNNRVGIVNASPTTALDVTGDITLSGGIYLGGTGSANYMNDYEEGTFTAQMFDANSGGNASSTTNTGYYTKIGQLVSVTFSLLNINKSGLTGSNVAYFTLPFTASLTKGRGSGAVRLDSVTFGGGRTQAVADVGENGSRCRLLIFGDGATDQSITVSDFNGTSSDISALSLVYITDS